LLGVALVSAFFFVFLVFLVFLAVWLVFELDAGACANANGIMAAANPSASKLFFMFLISLRAGLMVRSQFHDAAQSRETR
jgi:hypothetical protein